MINQYARSPTATSNIINLVKKPKVPAVLLNTNVAEAEPSLIEIEV